jgi:ABC-type multidrug transport system fused ATPase/permease subunit
LLCTTTQRAGDIFLISRGNPTEEIWIWYGFGVVVGEYIFLVFLTAIVLTYVRSKPSLPPPIIVPFVEADESVYFQAMSEKRRTSEKRHEDFMVSGGCTKVFMSDKSTDMKIHEIPFEPVVMSFKDVWYTVKIPKKDDIDLLQGVSGFFEPGSLTALMGSSGAGKTSSSLIITITLRPSSSSLYSLAPSSI